jgi:hypothetical protein
MRLIEKAFPAFLYHTQAPKSPQNSDFWGFLAKKKVAGTKSGHFERQDRLGTAN